MPFPAMPLHHQIGVAVRMAALLFVRQPWFPSWKGSIYGYP
jgi:hypothetical protein